MRAKKQPAIPGQRDAGQKDKQQFFNQPNLTPGALEKAIKNWAIDRLVEYHFDGVRSSQHKLAKAFWQKSGRRLTYV